MPAPSAPVPPSPPPAPSGVALEGAVERVTFANEENGFCVVRLAVPGRFEPVTAVGTLLGVQPGENLRLHGHWVTDRKFGEQFAAASYVTVQPSTLVGIEKYLGSGMVRGVGKVMAQRLVERFGLETLEVIEAQPERLTEVEGIGPVRRARIQSAWAEQRAIRQVMVFLQAHGVSATHAVKIFKRYGDAAIALVQENPYRLALDIYGIGFKTADRIARNLGIEPTSPRRAEAGVLHTLGELSEEGHVFAPREDLVKAASAMLEVDPALVQGAIGSMAAVKELVLEPGVAAEQEAVYLRSLHVAEDGSAALFRELLATPAAPLALDLDRAIAWFESKQGLQLAPEQREAIRLAAMSKAMVVTGGPGTGKTTLVNGIIQILERKGRRILLAAPTGRAAKRMTESTGRAAKTLHRLLEFSPKTVAFQRNRERPLEADLVVVDEASMVDTLLGYDLLKALPPTCQLVLVGDVDQLPSVGPGSVLGDVIRSGAVPVVRLQQIFRQAQQSLIVVNAHRVNHGELPLLREGDSDFYFIRREEPEEVLATVEHLVLERIPRRFGFDPVRDIQVLTPMHRGTLGAGNLNLALQAKLNPSGPELVRGARTLRLGDKVMQVRNDYDLDVFNGDVGRIEALDADEGLLRVRFDDRLVTYEPADADELVQAYACTVHKSQGSEYPCVVMPLHTQHFPMLQRNLLYTAMTRGRRLVVLVGTMKALALAVKRGEAHQRHTGFARRLAPR